MLDPRLLNWVEIRHRDLKPGQVFWKANEGYCIVVRSMGGSLKSYSLTNGVERTPHEDTIVRAAPYTITPDLLLS